MLGWLPIKYIMFYYYYYYGSVYLQSVTHLAENQHVPDPAALPVGCQLLLYLLWGGKEKEKRGVTFPTQRSRWETETEIGRVSRGSRKHEKTMSHLCRWTDETYSSPTFTTWAIFTSALLLFKEGKISAYQGCHRRWRTHGPVNRTFTPYYYWDQQGRKNEATRRFKNCWFNWKTKCQEDNQACFWRTEKVRFNLLFKLLTKKSIKKERNKNSWKWITIRKVDRPVFSQ